ncbi:cell envelope-related function transcriptional attenuator common domain-containing protein [Micromonospora pallida]|uniref:Cell envelope-related function transcriptional attenuator common domain-containing protein n=1 Tax=Micromonospora pallida TaxID=145854 RepID=A0A1C6TI81_9ACTN|nr:cell envelope-related function transcriptional attenuator common domain-containing protein [Micromonospora pallida]
MARSGKRGAKPSIWTGVPRWARLCTVFGAVLLMLSGAVLVGYEALLSRYEGSVGKGDLFGDQAAGAEEPRKEIEGPLNILLVGVDPRTPEAPPLADSIMIMHIPAEHDRAYLFSMPRDLRVEIPAFSKTGFDGGTDKLNAAMSYGSRVPGRNPDHNTGFELLAKTIQQETGIKRFDAGAIINFSGFQKIVDAMGGVEMYVEREVRSEHREPDGTHRKARPGGGGYLGPQAVYEKGTHQLKGWQALDYVRQRYPKNGVPDGDYGRQRHQQQFVKAMASQAFSADVVTNPIKLDRVLRAAGQSLVFSGRGNSIADFAFSLKGLRPDAIQMVKLPAEGIGTGSAYRGSGSCPGRTTSSPQSTTGRSTRSCLSTRISGTPPSRACRSSRHPR